MKIIKIINKLRFREHRRRILNLAGIATGKKAFKGPDVAQIDLTDRCNSHCLICWTNSPAGHDLPAAGLDLDFDKVIACIRELARAGASEIIFSGGGEPFMYSRIWEVLEFTRSQGINIRINTNFTLIDDEGLRKLASLDNLDSLSVSIWSADPGVYSALHGRDPVVFNRVKENLKQLNLIKKSKFKVRIAAIINSLNCRQIPGLLRLAGETGCEELELGVADVIPGLTDMYILNAGQIEEIKGLFGSLRRGEIDDHGVKIVNGGIFLKRVSSPGALSGEYDPEISQDACFAGWFFLRLRANGDFNSCLKSHRRPIGNINREPFSAVWNNPDQQRFRSQGLNIPRDNGQYGFIGNGGGQGCGCSRVCDNILINKRYNDILRCFLSK